MKTYAGIAYLDAYPSDDIGIGPLGTMPFVIENLSSSFKAEQVPMEDYLRLDPSKGL
jgi:hypothetical protein